MLVSFQANNEQAYIIKMSAQMIITSASSILQRSKDKRLNKNLVKQKQEQNCRLLFSLSGFIHKNKIVNSELLEIFLLRDC